ncbi:alpha/beta fold hydrolase [uncultured Arthrobacter sp.]|uniref:alpha/beta fold hydrolase n=1 Tax=uncultured Arthrobacter sp. TaxID=114050 RepID=UPI003216CE2D
MISPDRPVAFATVNGAELEYEVMGDGPELVWLHGMGGNLELERRSAAALARHHRVLWYSSRGHGRSSAPTERAGWSYAALAGDLDAMLDVVGFDRPLLVGGSHGANTILRHAVEHPGRARALILIAPGGNALARPARRQFAPIWLMLNIARLHGQDGLIRFVTGLNPESPEVDRDVLAAARTHDPRELARALRRIPDQSAVDEPALASIQVPAVVAAWGGDPIIHPLVLARRIADLIPGARFEQIAPLAGEPPQQVADRLAAFVLRWAGSLP